FALNADQRGPVLVIGKPDLQQAVGEERDANHGQEQRNIFAEERPADLSPAAQLRDLRRGNPGAIRHSITSAARARNGSAMVSPMALAALRLMISSNLVGCSIGRSPALAPLKILST